MYGEVDNNYDKDGKFIPNPDFPSEYEDIFNSQESVVSARVEFINMFTDYTYGISSDYIYKPETPQGRKRALLRDLYNLIVADGGITLRFNSILSHYGTHGLHPLDNVDRIRKIEADLSAAKTKMERERIIHDDDFEKRLYDPQYPPDLTIPKKAHPEPCKKAPNITPSEGIV